MLWRLRGLPWEPQMKDVTTIGLDLAKNVFQVHGVDAAGKTVMRRQVRRSDVLRFFSELPSCLVGMEACGTAHHWAREIAALGHTVRLMPPAYVKRAHGGHDRACAAGGSRHLNTHQFDVGRLTPRIGV